MCVCVLGNVNDSYCEYARAILLLLDSANHHKCVTSGYRKRVPTLLDYEYVGVKPSR